MSNLIEFLRQPASATTSGQRAAALLGGSDTGAFAAISLGDLIYDRVSIDPRALEAFDFAHRVNIDDVHALAVWSHEIILSEPSSTYAGHINRLQGLVFEKMAGHLLHQSGAVVVFPPSPTEPGWDFLVNGERVQAKCGLSAHLITEHLARYPDIPRVVVNEDLASHFTDNTHITPIAGITREFVRSTTEDSLEHAADMLDLHLASVVPAISVVRNAYHLWRGNTDWSALAGNITTDAAGRYTGAGAAKLAGTGAVMMLGLTGWPAILLPVFSAITGYRGGRAVSDAIKREVFLRSERAALDGALRHWCSGSGRVLTKMIALADITRTRFSAVRERAHPEYRAMVDDWLERLRAEQAYRQFHLERFERGAADGRVFDDGSGPLGASAASMVSASRAGILAADLDTERKLLTAAIHAYATGLRRRLLRRP
jgi:hypothetical protein